MSRIRMVFQGLISSRRGNVAPLAALMFPMVLLMMGGAMDYLQAGRRQEALQGISDAAALSALTPAMMQTTDAAATTTAQNLFAGQSGLLAGIGTLTYVAYPGSGAFPGSCNTNCYTIKVTDTVSGATILRVAQVYFNSTSSNVFTKILGFASTIIGGTSTAQNNLSPATNFYLLIDTSGSMGIPGTSAGITSMLNATNTISSGCQHLQPPNTQGYTPNWIKTTSNGVTTYNCTPPGGTPTCAFSCHESDVTAYADDNLWNNANLTCTASGQTDLTSWTTSGFLGIQGAGYSMPQSLYNGFTNNGTNTTPVLVTPYGVPTTFKYGIEDNYAVARCLGISLRIDLVNQAVTSLLSTAPTTAAYNHTTYGAALYTFDYTPTALHVLWPPSTVTYANNPTQFQTDMQNFTGAAAAAGTINQLEIYDNNNVTNGTANNDEDTWTDEALTLINGLMPNPGQGTGAAGDTPKEVVFLITDGVEDYVYNGARSYGPMNVNYTGTSFCDTIKNRGIRIAVLYLTYNPLDAGGTGSWYDTYIAPIQTMIQPAAAGCASSGLYTEVNTGGDVTAALQNLFQQAVATAYLSA